MHEQKTPKTQFQHRIEEMNNNEEGGTTPPRPYIPKYNTFVVNRNENLHMEADDDYFQRANSRVNILRSRGMIQEFHLDLHGAGGVMRSLFCEKDSIRGDDANDANSADKCQRVLQSMASSSNSDNVDNVDGGDGGDGNGGDWRQQNCFTNYRLMDQWNQEQQMDIYRELMGENEKLTLSFNSATQEIIYCIRKTESVHCTGRDKSINHNMNSCSHVDPDDDSSSRFKSIYLKYLQCIDCYLFSRSRSAEQIAASVNKWVIEKRQKKRHTAGHVYPRTMQLYFESINHIPLSVECVGYFSQTYYIPWLSGSTEVAQRDDVLVPWSIFTEGISLEAVQSTLLKHRSMYSLRNRFLGLYTLGYHRELTDLQTELLLTHNRESLLSDHSLHSLAALDQYHQRMSSFYLNERIRYSIHYRADVEKLKSLIRGYVHRERIRIRVLHYCSKF